ncbi:MAG TPA: 2-hydroxyacyl-CoA dehydratase family protein [Syntrophorhabdaceae bacterium]|nr:2-hydroxyacyl-CoA dehydratase family protein [Syntrophorhabdaceae bacterium]HQM82634.1 2-hydroxyacyl-CoA dehydratase family protein [Syntrophorhabdaceae bacterium]
MEKKGRDAIIERFRHIAENTPEYVRSLKEKGRLSAGYMCTHVPEEILYAAGIVPLRILTSHESQAMTRGYIHETYCSFSHDCAYQGLKGDYDHLDLIVTSSSCIHMGEAFNVWVRFAGFQDKSYLMQYPHIIHTKPAGGFMAESFKQFKEFVEKLTKRSVTDNDLEEAIKVYNHNRRLLKRLWEFLRHDRPPITGPEVAAVTLASQVMDKKECNGMLEQLIERLEAEPGQAAPGVRLMVTGGACDDLGLFDLMEHLRYDTSIIFIDSCTAARYFWFEVPEGRHDKLEALAEGYIGKIPCPAKDTVPGTGEKKRFRFVQQFIEDFKPDGVIFLYQRFCSPQPMDVVALKPIVDKLGIPSTELELDTTVPKAQFQTQLEALVEIIKGVTP